MPHYAATAADVASGATQNSFTVTILGLLAADTAGHRGRLRKLAVSLVEDTPSDVTWSVQLKRVDDVSAGSAGTATALTEAQKDANSVAPNIAALRTYTAEPSTYGEPLWQMTLNSRAGIVMTWDPDEAPVIQRDQLLGVLACNRSAAAALQVMVHAEWEEF